MKALYVRPAAEEFQELPAEAVLNASTEGTLEGYEQGNEFTW